MPARMPAQVLSDMHQRWDDDLSEWDVYAISDEDLPTATVELSGIALEDFYLWDITLGDVSGRIYRKWRDQDDLWQMNIGDDILLARRKWNNDYSAWIISYDSQRYTLHRDINQI